MLVSAYEARQQELLDENQGLQSALADLQSEHCALANQQAAAKQLQAKAVKHLMQDEEEGWTGQLEHLNAAALQAELSNKMDALAERMSSVEDLDEPLQRELGTALERRLYQELQTARQVVQEQVSLRAQLDSVITLQCCVLRPQQLSCIHHAHLQVSGAHAICQDPFPVAGLYNVGRVALAALTHEVCCMWPRSDQTPHTWY